jgi:hypothetical protein
MSGEMFTSLGNGFTTLMLWLFFCERAGSVIEPRVEGDDNVGRISGPIPTASDFLELGFRAKIEVHNSLNTASFCGNVFDEHDQTLICDVNKSIVKMAWSDWRNFTSGSKRKMTLLRAKAMSLHSQYPGCPVLDSFSLYIMRMTKSYDVRILLKSKTMAWWDRNTLVESLNFPHDRRRICGMETRLLVEELYGITVEQQLRAEDYFDRQTTIAVVPSWVMGDLGRPDWSSYSDAYVYSALDGDDLGVLWGDRSGYRADVRTTEDWSGDAPHDLSKSENY